jgi:hypothetical protein
MKYGITRAVHGFSGFLETTQDEFDSVVKGRKNLLALLLLEDKFDMLVSNFVEYEEALLDLTLHQLISGGHDWISFQTGRSLLNRRLGNLLSVARLYFDQVPQDLKRLGDLAPSLKAAFDDEKSKQYHAKLGYRVMEATRNHAQHFSLPVQSVTYSMHVDESSEPSRMISFATDPSLDTAKLELDPDFKREVLTELKRGDQYVSITPLVREYVEGIGEIHDRLRAIAYPSMVKWKTLIESVESRARVSFPDTQMGLAIVSEADDGTRVKTEYIVDDPWIYLKQLQKKNQRLRGLSNRYVTGKVQEVGRLRAEKNA